MWEDGCYIKQHGLSSMYGDKATDSGQCFTDTHTLQDIVTQEHSFAKGK